MKKIDECMKERETGELSLNPFLEIGKEWMLVTGGTPSSWNTMTASWGGMGHLWNRNVCFVFVRRTRYTWEFMERSERFSVSFFDPAWKEALALCGSKSGREVDKAKATGLEPVSLPGGAVAFSQARLVFECRKLYAGEISPGGFLDDSIHTHYPDRDWHMMYVGEVERVFGV